MDELTRYLYDFVCSHRLESLHRDPEYQSCTRRLWQQEERVSGYLSQEQRRELRFLLDSVSEQGSIEHEHLFRATLGLVRELNGLMNTGS